jgi:hypothetical protein
VGSNPTPSAKINDLDSHCHDRTNRTKRERNWSESAHDSAQSFADCSQRRPPPENESAATTGIVDGAETAKGYQNLQDEKYAAPAASASVADVKWMRRDAIREFADILASLAVSLGEAAYVGSDHLIEAHTRQAIATVKATAQTVRELRGLRS